MLWRFLVPRAVVAFLDKADQLASGPRSGGSSSHPGNVIDYNAIDADTAADCKVIRVMAANYDEWSGEPARQAIQNTRLDISPIPQTFRDMIELMALTKSRG